MKMKMFLQFKANTSNSKIIGAKKKKKKKEGFIYIKYIYDVIGGYKSLRQIIFYPVWRLMDF